MTWIYLKLLLAVFLTAIPFVVKYYAIPKGKKNRDWVNLFTLIGNKFPNIMTISCKLIKSFLALRKMMSISKKSRRFYSFILIVFFITIQVVNNKASLQVADINKSAMFRGGMDALTNNYISLLDGRFIIVLGIDWFREQPTTNLIMLIFTLLLFRKHFAEKCLSQIRDSHNIQLMVLFIATASLFTPKSDGFLISEVLLVLLLFAFDYPKFNKDKSMRFYAIKYMRKTRTSARDN